MIRLFTLSVFPESTLWKVIHGKTFVSLNERTKKFFPMKYRDGETIKLNADREIVPYR